jgi:hypothetical protein
MDTGPQTTERSGTTDSLDEEKIRISDRIVLCLFVLVFLGFGLILIGDLLSALWR